MTIRFELPICILNKYHDNWNSGRIILVDESKDLYLASMSFCNDGVKEFFQIPDNAFAIQFVVTSNIV